MWRVNQCRRYAQALGAAVPGEFKWEPKQCVNGRAGQCDENDTQCVGEEH